MKKDVALVLSRTFSIRYTPDVLVKMPFDAYGEIADYAKAEEISQRGRELMKAALDRYEQISPLGRNDI